MHIEHVALWTQDLERAKNFYVTFFDGQANEKYTNPRTGFSSYFLTFDSGARLEIMQMPSILASPHELGEQHVGIVHLAFAVGSREQVDGLTQQLQEYGCQLVSGPRVTGDGYYESCVLDPDGTRIELTE